MKVAIFGGGGGVGSSTAFNLLTIPGAHDVVLVDVREEMVASHLLDLEQVLEQGGTGTVRAGEPADLLDADVVVLTAAAPLGVNRTRLAYLEDNAAIVDSVVEPLEAVPGGWPGVLVLVTNPVDPLCTRVCRRTGIPRTRVLGYTLNDRLRLETGVARALGAPPGSVEAWVLGEHGDESVPLFGRITVDGEPTELTAAQRSEADEFLRTWYVRHVALDSGRSSTWTSGLGVARMVAAIADDARFPWPASLVLEGEYGVDGVALTVPVTLGRAGALAIHEWELTPDERARFQRGAEVVREAVDRIGSPRLAVDRT